MVLGLEPRLGNVLICTLPLSCIFGSKSMPFRTDSKTVSWAGMTGHWVRALAAQAWGLEFKFLVLWNVACGHVCQGPSYCGKWTQADQWGLLATTLSDGVIGQRLSVSTGVCIHTCVYYSDRHIHSYPQSPFFFKKISFFETFFSIYMYPVPLW